MLVTPGLAVSQSYYAYTESGDSVSLTLQDSVVTAKLVEGLQFWTAVYAGEAALDGSISPEPLSDGFYRLRVVQGYDPVALVDRLSEDEDIQLANVSFLDVNNNPIYVTETFVANFNVTASPAEIDSINTAHSVGWLLTLSSEIHIGYS